MLKAFSKELLEGLRGGCPGLEISTDASDLAEFGRDWTKKYEPKASAILFPRSTEEVAAIVRFCNRADVALVPSGGRTGLAGGAVAKNGELVLSLAKMNKIGALDIMARTLHVQAGAITEAVHNYCEAEELTWPVDFGSKGSSHIGGNISTNAGGVRVIRYGLTRNWVLGLTVVTGSGEILRLNGALEKNNTGPDLRQMFIGSEGIFGIVTEAVLKLTTVPRDVEVLLFGVDSAQTVFKVFEDVRRSGFSLMAFECMAKNCVDAVRVELGMKYPFAEAPAYSVLIEIERSGGVSSEEKIEEWVSSLFERGLVLDGTRANTPEQRREIWKVRESIAEALVKRGLNHKHDISFPIVRLQEFLVEFEKVYVEHKSSLEVYVFGHIGDGNLHLNYIKPAELSREDFYKACDALDSEMFKLIEKYQGSVSAEHGIGLLKKELLKYSRAPAELELFRAMKKVFDPKGILNPGKIFD